MNLVIYGWIPRTVFNSITVQSKFFVDRKLLTKVKRFEPDLPCKRINTLGKCLCMHWKQESYIKLQFIIILHLVFLFNQDNQTASEWWWDPKLKDENQIKLPTFFTMMSKVFRYSLNILLTTHHHNWDRPHRSETTTSTIESFFIHQKNMYIHTHQTTASNLISAFTTNVR